MAVAFSTVSGENLHSQQSSEKHSSQLAFSESPTASSKADFASGLPAATTIAVSLRPLSPAVPTCAPALCFTATPNSSSNLIRNFNAITPSQPLILSRNKRAVSQFSATRLAPLMPTSLVKPATETNVQSSGINLSIPVSSSKKSNNSLEVVLYRRKRAKSTAYVKSDQKAQPLKSSDDSSHQSAEERWSLHIPRPNADKPGRSRANSTMASSLYKSHSKPTKPVTDNTEVVNSKPLSKIITAAVTRMFPSKSDEIMNCYAKLSRASNGSGGPPADNPLNKRLFDAYYTLSLRNGIGNLVIPNKVTTLEAYVSFIEGYLSR